MDAQISTLNPIEILNPLNKIQRKQYVMLLERFEQYTVRSHIEVLRQHGQELDRMKQKRDRRNILAERMEAARILQQIRVDLVDLSRIKEQAVCPEDADVYQSRGEKLRVMLIRAAAEILEKHPEIKQPVQEQEDVQLTEHEKAQGYALAADEIAREKDRLADQEDVLLRVETIHTDIAHVAGMMDQFWTILEAQGKSTNAIDVNIAEAEIAATEGLSRLQLAAQYKAGLYPMVGAIIGGAVAGPLGAVLGLKLLAVAAAAAGSFIVGRSDRQNGSSLDDSCYQGGNVVRRRQLMMIPVQSRPRDVNDIPQEDPKKTE